MIYYNIVFASIVLQYSTIISEYLQDNTFDKDTKWCNAGMCSSRHCTIFVPHSRRRSIGQVATNSAHELIRSVVHLLKALQPCGCPRSVTGDPRQSMKRLSNPGPVWGGSQDGLAHFLVGKKWNDWSICLQSVRVEQLRTYVWTCNILVHQSRTSGGILSLRQQNSAT